jgi:hypothetical protein
MIDEHTGAFAPGDFLQLRLELSPEKFRYILGLTGDGRAQIYTEAALKKVDWGWEITGPITETIILLASTERQG